METAQFTYDEQIFSDLHKDAFGFRPRGHEFYDAAPERKQVIWDETLRVLESTLAEEKARKDEAAVAFEARIAGLITTGAADRSTAIRWYINSMDLSRYDLAYGGGFVCWELGLPYEGYKAEFDAAIKAGVTTRD